MPREHVTMNLRLPPEIHAELKAVAEQERRSINNLILYLLEQALNQRKGRPSPKSKK